MKTFIKYYLLLAYYKILSFAVWVSGGLKFFSRKKLIIGSLLLSLFAVETVMAEDSSNKSKLKTKKIVVKKKSKKRQTYTKTIMCYFIPPLDSSNNKSSRSESDSVYIEKSN